MLILFLKLVIGHFLFDFPFQGQFLSDAKNHRQPIPGVPWPQALFAHAAIQGGMVWFITGSLALGVIEFFLHALIDYLKSDGRLSFTADQALHILCKAVYVYLVLENSRLLSSLASALNQ